MGKIFTEKLTKLSKLLGLFLLATTLEVRSCIETPATKSIEAKDKRLFKVP